MKTTRSWSSQEAAVRPCGPSVLAFTTSPSSQKVAMRHILTNRNKSYKATMITSLATCLILLLCGASFLHLGHCHVAPHERGDGDDAASPLHTTCRCAAFLDMYMLHPATLFDHVLSTRDERAFALSILHITPGRTASGLCAATLGRDDAGHGKVTGASSAGGGAGTGATPEAAFDKPAGSPSYQSGSDRRTNPGREATSHGPEAASVSAPSDASAHYSGNVPPSGDAPSSGGASDWAATSDAPLPPPPHTATCRGIFWVDLASNTVILDLAEAVPIPARVIASHLCRRGWVWLPPDKKVWLPPASTPWDPPRMPGVAPCGEELPRLLWQNRQLAVPPPISARYLRRSSVRDMRGYNMDPAISALTEKGRFWETMVGYVRGKSSECQHHVVDGLVPATYRLDHAEECVAFFRALGRAVLANYEEEEGDSGDGEAVSDGGGVADDGGHNPSSSPAAAAVSGAADGCSDNSGGGDGGGGGGSAGHTAGKVSDARGDVDPGSGVGSCLSPPDGGGPSPNSVCKLAADGGSNPADASATAHTASSSTATFHAAASNAAAASTEMVSQPWGGADQGRWAQHQTPAARAPTFYRDRTSGSGRIYPSSWRARREPWYVVKLRESWAGKGTYLVVPSSLEPDEEGGTGALEAYEGGRNCGKKLLANTAGSAAHGGAGSGGAGSGVGGGNENRPGGGRQGPGDDQIVDTSVYMYKPLGAGEIVQRYVRDPLLIDGCKFHIRAYALVPSFDPLVVLFAPEANYYQRNSYEYKRWDSRDMDGHVTNIARGAKGYQLGQFLDQALDDTAGGQRGAGGQGDAGSQQEDGGSMLSSTTAPEPAVNLTEALTRAHKAAHGRWQRPDMQRPHDKRAGGDAPKKAVLKLLGELDAELAALGLAPAGYVDASLVPDIKRAIVLGLRAFQDAMARRGHGDNIKGSNNSNFKTDIDGGDDGPGGMASQPSTGHPSAGESRAGQHGSPSTGTAQPSPATRAGQTAGSLAMTDQQGVDGVESSRTRQIVADGPLSDPQGAAGSEAVSTGQAAKDGRPMPRQGGPKEGPAVGLSPEELRTRQQGSSRSEGGAGVGVGLGPDPFQLFAFDFMVDASLRLVFLEVNHNPFIVRTSPRVLVDMLDTTLALQGARMAGRWPPPPGGQAPPPMTGAPPPSEGGGKLSTAEVLGLREGGRLELLIDGTWDAGNVEGC